jgi:hypothetical protein
VLYFNHQKKGKINMVTVRMNILPQTDEEIKAVEELLTKMREERRREEAIRQNTERLENIVMATIEAIGLEETKRIIRNINRSLRMSGEERPF